MIYIALMQHGRRLPGGKPLPDMDADGKLAEPVVFYGPAGPFAELGLFTGDNEWPFRCIEIRGDAARFGISPWSPLILTRVRKERVTYNRYLAVCERESEDA